MLSRKDNFTKKSKLFSSTRKSEKEKGSRLGIALLFLGTFFLSSLFWLRSQAEEWWQRITTPSVYKISRTSDKELIKILGIKPDLTDFNGVKNSINLLTQNLNGDYGLYFYRFKQNNFFEIKGNQIFKAASVNKIPIIVSFYQQVEKGKLDETREYVLKKEDIQDYGAGSMRYKTEGTKYKYNDLIKLIGRESDNTAAYVIANLIGKDGVQNHLTKLGMENTLIKDNTTTPIEMGGYLVKLYKNGLVGKEYKEKILTVLTETDFEDRIPKGIPKTVKVVHKTGNEIQVYNDCAVILSSDPYVLCILTEEVVEEEALKVIPKISRLIWEFVNK